VAAASGPSLAFLNGWPRAPTSRRVGFGSPVSEHGRSSQLCPGPDLVLAPDRTSRFRANCYRPGAACQRQCGGVGRPTSGPLCAFAASLPMDDVDASLTEMERASAIAASPGTTSCSSARADSAPFRRDHARSAPATRPPWQLRCGFRRALAHPQMPSEPREHPLANPSVQLAAVRLLQVCPEILLRTFEGSPCLVPMSRGDWRSSVAPRTESDHTANMAPSAISRQHSQQASGSGTLRGGTGEYWTIDVVICPSAKNRSMTSVNSSMSAAWTFSRTFSSPVTR
jgi:hypothetical protein